MKTFRWGIIGTAHIATKFIEGLKSVKGAEAYAIASRTTERALTFANEHSIAVAYGSYEELVQDKLIDAIYIATPNNCHYEHTMLCLNAGKAVLCEKPFALNSLQLSEMVGLAKSKNVFLMEALWTRFLPTIKKVSDLVEAGAIGEPHLIKADFGFKAQYSPHSRLFDPNLGGGSVLDIGIYPLFLATHLFGFPEQVTSLAIQAPTGTDMTTGMVLKHQKNRMSILASTFATSLETKAEIIGSEGTITLHRMFHMPTAISLTQNGKTKKITVKLKGNGYNYEAEEVMKCIAKGKTESDLLPLSYSIELMKLLDKVQNK